MKYYFVILLSLFPALGCSLFNYQATPHDESIEWLLSLDPPVTNETVCSRLGEGIPFELNQLIYFYDFRTGDGQRRSYAFYYNTDWTLRLIVFLIRDGRAFRGFDHNKSTVIWPEKDKGRKLKDIDYEYVWPTQGKNVGN